MKNPMIAAYTDATPDGMYPCQLLEQGFVPGLQQSGIRADYIPTRLTGADLTSYIDREKPDYFVFLGIWLPEYADMVAQAQARGIGLIWWATEDPCAYDVTLNNCARHADIILSTSIECVHKYHQLGKVTDLLTFGCNPDYHKPCKKVPQYSYDWIAACSYYPGNACRQRGMDTVLKAVIDSPFDGFVSGNTWFLPGAESYFTKRDIRRAWIPCSEMPSLFSSATINIGLQNDDTGQTQTSMRPYEILSCGGFLLSQWTPAIFLRFNDGEHLVLSESYEQTQELLAYYLSHDEERQRIAQQGKKFVLKNYTYSKMLTDNLLPLL